MFFIYASFLEFILVNYLARWVQDPEQKKQNRDNAILDVSIFQIGHIITCFSQSLRLVSHSLEVAGKAITSLTGMGSISSNEQEVCISIQICSKKKYMNKLLNSVQ